MNRIAVREGDKLKKFSSAAVAIGALLVSVAAMANGRAVELIVPFSAGGSTDIFAKFLAKELAPQLNATVIVINKPGAGGSLGATAAAHAKPDGSTILLGTISTHAISPSAYTKVKYDPQSDFVPVAKLVTMPNVLAVRAESELNTVDDLLKKAATTDMTFGSAGGGTTSNLAGELMKQMRPELKFTHVPYKGSAPAVSDLLGGNIDFQFDNLTSLLSHIESGRLRALAVSSSAPAEQLPGVKPLAELGFKGYEMESWFALFLPKGASSAFVAALTEALRKVYQNPQFLKHVKDAGGTPSFVYGADFEKFLLKEQSKWKEVVMKANIKLD